MRRGRSIDGSYSRRQDRGRCSQCALPRSATLCHALRRKGVTCVDVPRVDGERGAIRCAWKWTKIGRKEGRKERSLE